MKKTTFKKIIFTAALLSLTSSIYAEKAAPQSDDYADETPVESTKIKTDKAKKSNSSKPKKSANESIKEFIFGKQKYVFYDTTTLSSPSLIGELKQREAELILKPTTKEAGLRTYFQTSWYDLLFDEPNRTKIISSVNKYLNDFEAHNLDKKAAHIKTRRVYCNNGKNFVQWGTTKAMMSSYGYAKFNCGYEFKKVKGKTSPYFTITVEKAKNINEKAGTNTSPETTDIQLYFTKAQAKALAELLSRETIIDQMKEYAEIQSSSVDEDYDDSDNYDAADSYDEAPAEADADSDEADADSDEADAGSDEDSSETDAE